MGNVSVSLGCSDLEVGHNSDSCLSGISLCSLLMSLLRSREMCDPFAGIVGSSRWGKQF